MDTTGSEHGRTPARDLPRWVGIAVVAFGIASAVAGVVLMLVPSGQASFGWFAYAPLSRTAFVPTGTLLSQLDLAGLALLVIGLVALAFSAGWALGRRTPSG